MSVVTGKGRVGVAGGRHKYDDGTHARRTNIGFHEPQIHNILHAVYHLCCRYNQTDIYLRTLLGQVDLGPH